MKDYNYPMSPGIDFPVLIKNFEFEGDFLDATPYGSGHIHNTYAARFIQPNCSIRRYLLQRMNQYVFKESEKVMQNIERVTTHLRKRIIAEGGDFLRKTINLVPAVNGSSFYHAENGEFWRAEFFIEGAQTFQTAINLDHYYQVANAFGKFQKYMSDFPVEELHITIPDFHHTQKRFEALIQAIENDLANRAASVKSEIDFCLSRSDETTRLINLLQAGKIPERVTHNDTKLDNVMIDDITGEGICVIDLDTVMPGLVAYDFGDSVRSGANPAPEDEPDLSKVCFSLQIFDRLAQGFLDAARDYWLPMELDTLAFGAKLITFEQGLRFLTDYLNGDVYYKIHRVNHNLDRCRTQFKLVSDMEACFEQMVKIVEKFM
jgi:thiamine kinase-like enzyme